MGLVHVYRYSLSVLEEERGRSGTESVRKVKATNKQPSRPTGK